VRSGSTKQLGSAVGDGIAALLMTRRYLQVHHHMAVPLASYLAHGNNQMAG
jgi:hypothetical protein